MKSVLAALLIAIVLCSQALAAPCTPQVLEQRDAMRERLGYASRRGLEGDRHYTITFLTQAKGVVLPAALLAQYPQEMTIILQFQFEQLKVSAQQFEVMLWFKGVRTRVVVPFNAVTIFVDPSVNFRLDTDPAFQGQTCDGA